VPAATVLDCVPGAFARGAAAIAIDHAVLDGELATIQTNTPGQDRRVLGVMNDFAHRAEHHR